MNVGQEVRRQEIIRAWTKVVFVEMETDLQYILELASLSKGLNIGSGKISNRTHGVQHEQLYSCWPSIKRAL